MKGKSYSEKLKDPRWQKKRLEILQRDQFTCQICGDKETTLHVHHSKYVGEPWDAPNEVLKTLCEHCHTLLEPDGIINDGSSVKKIELSGGGLMYFFIKSNVAVIYASDGAGLPLNLKLSMSAFLVKELYEFSVAQKIL